MHRCDLTADQEMAWAAALRATEGVYRGCCSPEDPCHWHDGYVAGVADAYLERIRELEGR